MLRVDAKRLEKRNRVRFNEDRTEIEFIYDMPAVFTSELTDTRVIHHGYRPQAIDYRDADLNPSKTGRRNPLWMRGFIPYPHKDQESRAGRPLQPWEWDAIEA